MVIPVPRVSPASAADGTTTTTNGETTMRNFTDACGQQWVDHGMGWVPLGVSRSATPQPTTPQLYATSKSYLHQLPTWECPTCPDGYYYISPPSPGTMAMQLCTGSIHECPPGFNRFVIDSKPHSGGGMCVKFGCGQSVGVGTGQSVGAVVEFDCTDCGSGWNKIPPSGVIPGISDHRIELKSTCKNGSNNCYRYVAKR